MSAETKPRWRSAALLLVGVALFAGLLWALGTSWSELRRAASFDARGVLASLIGSGIASLATAARWKWIAEQMGGTRLGFGRYLHALVLTRLVGSFTSALAVDLLGRGVALQRAGSERSVGHTASAVIVERMHDVLLPACLLPWAIWWRDSLPALMGVVVGFACFATVAHGPLVRLGIATYARLRRKDDFVLPDARLLSPRAGAAVTAASLGRYLGLSIHVFGAAMAVGIALNLIEVVAVSPPAQLSSLIGFTPGALGIQEVGWAAGLGIIGKGATAIALFVIAQRALFITSFAALTGMTWPWRGEPSRPNETEPGGATT